MQEALHDGMSLVQDGAIPLRLTTAVDCMGVVTLLR